MPFYRLSEDHSLPFCSAENRESALVINLFFSEIHNVTYETKVETPSPFR
jgi:hypothetical protein